MSHKRGAYLGGIRTLEDLRQRCHIDGETGCWHWRLCINQGSPNVWLQPPGRDTRVRARGRRAALWLARGKDLQQGCVAIARGCTALDCVNPKHAMAASKAEFVRHVWASRPPQVLERSRKLDAATVTAIRASSESDLTWARRLGIGRPTVESARKGKTFRWLPPALPSIFGSTT